MPNLLKLKRGTAATIPVGTAAEPLFTTDTYDLYIGKGNGSNQRFQKYIASGTSSQFLKGDGSLDSNSYQTALTFSSPLVNTSGTISIPAASGSVNGYLTSTDWTTFNNKQASLTLTTTGTSGAATLVGATLNIPQYQSVLTNPVTGTGTLNEIAYWTSTSQIGALTTATYPSLTELSYVKGVTSAIQTQLNAKEPTITAGTSLQYYRGDKTFQTLNTAAVPESGSIYFTEPRVLATVLTGLNLSGGGTIAATDSVLTAFGKIQNQISGIAGGVSYQTTWNASTNTPTLTSSVGTKGYYYVVSVAGSTNLNGITDWKVGDWAIFNGTTWDKVDNTDAVSSVNGFTGAVNLGLGDISNVTLTSPTNGQLLQFNGTSSKWVNWTPTYISGNQTITLSGDISGSGTTAITTTIGALKVTNAMLAGTIDYAKMDATTVPTWNQNTTGSAATLTTARTLTIGSTGKTFNGSANVSWSLAEIGAFANPMTTLGDIIYGGASGAATRLAGNTVASKRFLTQTGDGTNSAAPSWGSIAAADVPTLNQNTTGSAATLTYPRNFTINGTAKSFDGSANVSWTAAEIGLTSYLPLTGGTLTGALNGTSATFSSSVTAFGVYITNTANADVLEIFQSPSTLHSYIDYPTSRNLYFRNKTTGTALTLASTGAATFSSTLQTSGDITINSTNAILTANNLLISGTLRKFQVWNGVSAYIDVLNFASTGAATFSSSVTASGGFEIPNGQFYRARRSSGSLLTDMIGIPSGTDDVRILTTGDFNILNGSLSNIFTVKNGGNVGIGTTSPAIKLEVASSGSNSFFRNPSSTAATTYITVVNANNTSNGLVMAHISDGTGYFGTQNSADLRFVTGDTERMRITSGGNVGIGTTSPSYKLQVDHATTSQYAASIRNTGDNLQIKIGTTTGGLLNIQGSTISTDVAYNIALQAQGGNVGIGTTSPATDFQVVRSGSVTARFTNTATSVNTEIGVTGGLGYVGTQSANAFGIFTSDTERMRITSGGNVAIGNTAANTELHIHSSDTDTRIQITNSTTGTSSNTGLALAQQSDNTYIYNYQNGPMIFGTYGTERMRISATGELWIAGTTDQGAYNLQCNGTGVWGAGAYVNGSDIALKDNINDIGSTIEIIKKLKPKTFNYKNWYSKDQDIQTGFIAQELEEVLYDKLYLKGIVKSGKKYKNVAYQNIIPLLVKAIQEQQIEIDNLKSK